MKLEDFFKEDLVKIDSSLRRFLPRTDVYPQSLHEAMHYAVLMGGKRFRRYGSIAVLFPASNIHNKPAAIHNSELNGNRNKAILHIIAPIKK